MATLIEVKTEGGMVLGRCDARCYNAEGPLCDCVCGGKNHGQGLNAAIANAASEYKEGTPEEGRSYPLFDSLMKGVKHNPECDHNHAKPEPFQPAQEPVSVEEDELPISDLPGTIVLNRGKSYKTNADSKDTITTKRTRNRKAK